MRPNVYASFHRSDGDGCMIRNDQGQELWVTRDATGDVAVMLADFCQDPDLAEFVSDTWRGRSDELEEYGPDDESDDMLGGAPYDNESMIDLGGGMVVPLAELLEDDDDEASPDRPA